MKTLRFILGDQLNHKHSWYQNVQDNVIYMMAEMRQETDYARHHIQKIVGFFKAMRYFKEWLASKGHHVLYYTLDDPENQHTPTANIQQVIQRFGIEKIEYQLPDEYRLDQEFLRLNESLNIPVTAADTEHFMTSREDLTQFFKGKKQYTMEFFYRMMRKRYQLMMVNDTTPEGGQWNFDQSNRQQWKGTPQPTPEYVVYQDVRTLVDLLAKEGIETIGDVQAEAFSWPTTRKEALATLKHFCVYLLPHFGDFQDAMDPEEDYLFHSRLSFALNCKLIDPLEVVETVIAYWRDHQEIIHISQVEGFVRQIIGWREYMRGMYWMQMPHFAKANHFENTNPLPDFFWTGATKMKCLKHAITGSLKNAYAHHIQRLMVTGNYALLTMTHPDAVDAWYLGIYIDAIEWVEITNTRGMSQWADGGSIATKPYVSSGSYINKMSNYCKGCTYKVSQKTGEEACPFNSLYWNFLDEKQTYFKGNQRMRMMLNLLHKMDKDTLMAHKERAQHIIANPHVY